MVTGSPVWTICIVSTMIASWFSIARKCEELPLQRAVCPTSTNPQLMASRSNRPQQPHILQRLHVHNSFARLEKRSQIVKIHHYRKGKTLKYASSPWDYIWGIVKYFFWWLGQKSSFFMSKKPQKKAVVIISDNFPHGRSEAVCSSDSEKQAQLSLVASSWTNRP